MVVSNHLKIKKIKTFLVILSMILLSLFLSHIFCPSVNVNEIVKIQQVAEKECHNDQEL